ncbi:MAG: transketolase [Spirochaetes bacterium]|nr:transketolase [Spirochaetota bacterium]
MNSVEMSICHANAALLRIKEQDIRLKIILQGETAIDKGVHIGGAYSAVLPMVSLYYGGYMDIDPVNPTALGKDMFVLSKGHAVAAMAAVYEDLGYFPREILEGSRSIHSILKGHPGPILPGVPLSTGPLGQGICVAGGFAMAGRDFPHFNVFCLTGDGELQEGMPWEAISHAGARRLNNFCVLVDANNGQLDNVDALIYQFHDLPGAFESFGWRVFNVDGTRFEPITAALDEFRNDRRSGKPTAIIVNSSKGFGGIGEIRKIHKHTFTEEQIVVERRGLEARREGAAREFELIVREALRELGEDGPGSAAFRKGLADSARRMRYELTFGKAGAALGGELAQVPSRRASPRDKRIRYEASALPVLTLGKGYSASSIISQCMKVFAHDSRVVTVDSDLSSTSGLQEGLSLVAKDRAFNVGIAESNMMNIGEAFAILGKNVWVSTFCPFFDWRVLRRIAIGYQERAEAIAAPDGWLAEGHNLDITFLATAPNIETRTNGATHMGNDDSLVFDSISHLKIIDISCPQQLIAVCAWIMEGNRGLVYLRIPRSPSPALYKADFSFEYGKAYWLRGDPSSDVVIISAGRGVLEALAAADVLAKAGKNAAIVDMQSTDAGTLRSLATSGKPVLIAEQNNGYILRAMEKAAFGFKGVDRGRIAALNLQDENGATRFIHSATYDELLEEYGLSAAGIAERALILIGAEGKHS